MKTIELTQGKSAIVDDYIYPVASQFKWYAEVDNRSSYALREIRFDGKRKGLYLHHLVVGFPLRGMVVDHINGDGLDNRSENLRIISHRENIGNNRNKRLGLCKSQFVGVSKEKRNLKKPWKAQARINGKSVSIGMYTTPLEASIAYQDFVTHKIPKESK